MKIILNLFFLFLLSPVFAHAGNDLTITCPDNGPNCTKSADLPLLEQINIFPGYIQSPPQVMTVVNQDTDEDCNLSLKASNVTGSTFFANRLTISITSNSVVIFAGNLSDLIDGNSHSLATVLANSTRQYLWTPSLDQEAGNDYQKLSSKFDLNFNFSCGQEPLPTATPTPTTAASDGGGAILGAASAPTCNDTPPAGAPYLISIISGFNSATLNWTPAPDPVTYYLIAFGTSPGQYQYGNPNIGGRSTTSYTVNNLSGNQTYYFAIRAGNGCATGPFSQELNTAPSGVILAPEVVPAGFQPGVLGESTTETTPTSGQVEGTTTCDKHWFPLLFLLVFVINIFYFRHHRSLLIPLLLCLLAYLIDAYVLRQTCCSTNPLYCRYFWIGNVLAFLLPFRYFRR